MTRMGCNPEVQAWGVSAKSGKLEFSGRAQRPDRGETGASDQSVRSRDALHDAPFYQHRLDPPERMLGIRRHHEQVDLLRVDVVRSEEHTSELQSLMRISYAVFCLKTKNKRNDTNEENMK